MKPIKLAILSVTLLASILAAACSSDEDGTATPDLNATELAAVQATATGQSITQTEVALSFEATTRALETAQPPTPTPVPPWSLDPIKVSNVSCVDFNPGVPSEIGPNRWIDVSGTLENTGDETLWLTMRFDVLDADGNIGEISVFVTDLRIPPKTEQPFSQQFDRPAPPEGSLCRVSFSDSSLGQRVLSVTEVPVEQLFLP